MNGSETPALSVVIPSVTGWTSLSACLESLRDQRDAGPIEVLVVDRLGNGVRSRVRAHFPNVTVVPAPATASIPSLRASGMRAAGAPVVGVIEDHLILPPTWAAQMLAAHRDGAEVVGGSIENAATARRSDWAAFLCEYHHCLNPGPAGPATWLPGNNVTYRRDVLDRFGTVLEQGRWENVLHDAMRAAGITLERRPEITVGHKLHISPLEYLAQRFLYSRSYAAMRLAEASMAARLAYGAAAIALPPVLFARIVRAAWRTGRNRRELAFSLPLFVPFTIAWAAGEVVGAWFGGGNALARVR